jgi:hypothetical protein
VDDPLRYAFVVKMGDLLAQMKILEQRRTAVAGLKRVIGVGQPETLGGGKGIPGLRPIGPVR